MNTTSLCFVLLITMISASAQDNPALRHAKQNLQEWRNSRTSLLMDDFGELARYEKANATVPAPSPGEKRVVFFGDSITDGWDLAKSFPQSTYINRGISGQTTAQMLLRFREDVVNLQPKVVVILAGTNDIAGNTGPMPLPVIEANFASMAEIARANGIRVIFSSVLPLHNYTPDSDKFFPLRSTQQLLALNAWLKRYSAEHGHTYLDYYSGMLDEKGFLKLEYSEDGLHPNTAGYAKMTPLAEAAIRQTLQTESLDKKKPGN